MAAAIAFRLRAAACCILPILPSGKQPTASRYHGLISAQLQPDPRYTFGPSVTRRRFLLGGGLAAIGVGIYADLHARHELEVVPITIRLRNLPTAFAGFRIVQISDFHLVEYTEPWFLERVVDRVNALTPDLVLLTGDFISRGPRAMSVAAAAMPVCAEVLGRLTCAERYAIIGNHDTALGTDIVAGHLAANNITTLVNEHIALDRRGDRLWICGVDDPGTADPHLHLAIPKDPGAPVILMAHEPDYIDRVMRHAPAFHPDLMLSGHTHGGQVCLPVFGPLILPPMGLKYIKGHFRFGQTQLYVNRGIGATSLPFRLNCAPEITHITLQSA